MTDIRLKLTEEEAEMILRRLPLPRAFWLDIADRFIEAMDPKPVEQMGIPTLNCWQVAPGTPDSDGIVWERYELGCSGKNKGGEKCQRFIVGLMGYNGGFEHKVLGHCDLRNKHWLCWQHGAERDREDAKKKEETDGR